MAVFGTRRARRQLPTKSRRGADMRVGIVYDRKHGGLPKLLLSLSSVLSRQGDCVLVCAPLRYHLGWAQEAMSYGVKTFEMYSHRILNQSRTTQKALSRFDPDIVVSAHRGCDVRTSQLCRMLEVPHVITVHGNPSSQIDMQEPSIHFLTARNYLWRRALARSSYVVCVSEWVAAGLMTGFGVEESKVRVIHNGIRVDKYAATKPKHLSGSMDGLRVLAVGRLSREKNPNLMVDLITKMRSQGIEVSGVWIGDGPLREEMVDYAQRCAVGKYVEFPGNVERPLPFYRDADFLVHFRVDEGFGLVLAEAQAAGLPILAFRAGAVPEVVENGTVGLLSDEGDVDGMVGHIKDLLGDPPRYNRMSEEGIKSARVRFSAERMGNDYQSVLRTLAR